VLAVLIVGLAMNAVALPLAGRRVWFLYRVISSGQPAPDRIEGVTSRLGAAVKRQVVEVFGQKKLLKWSVPGAAHFFVFWAFLILATVYLEAYGSLLKLLFHGGDAKLDWSIPLVGHWWILGFAQDFIAMMAFFGILTFVVIRVRNAPKELGRRSRFFGSHLSGAWITLFMIFNVIWTMFLFRGSSAALGNLPYKNGAFISIGLGKLLDGMSHGALDILEGIGLLLHIGVMLVFLIFVLNSKHLHIFVAPLNVLFGRQPVALGAAKPMMNAGKPITLDDFEDLDEDARLGVGAAEDFSWKGILDFTTCTECGRCQDQCPAWNTEKPLSPKLMIMALRDHTLAKAPYLLADEDRRDGLLEGNDALKREVERPLVGDTGDDWFYMPDSGAAVIDPDVLWSCVTCGACVQQCPVDIEHVDHIVDMRRYQVLVESNFPAELNGLFKGLENKGNPWNMSATARLDWAKDLPFDVKVVGEDIESLDEVDWLFWVGCAGAYEDRAKKTTRAVAELLDLAGVSFGVLGNGETCTGDSARRAGNEFVFQGLAAQNVETFKEHKVKKVVSTCAHCFNTLKNEYQEFGIELEVVHHTQLLNRLVREKKLVPIAAQGGTRSVTYHDPCYLGRHNQVYSPPRELLEVIPNADFVEMPRNQERSFCCGAGGARMWMEETIGTRINSTRTKEAVATGADQIAVGCPFCRVMLSDGLTEQQSKGEAREEVEVLDVAQMLLASIKGDAPSAKKADKKAAAKTSATSDGEPSTAATASTETAEDDEATKSEPDAEDVTQTEDTVTDTADVGPAAKASGGGSLFDLDEESAAEEKPATEDEADAPEDAAGDSTTDGSKDDADAASSAPADSIPESGSLFDLEAPAEEADAEPAPEKADEPEDKAGDSTTDGETDRTEDDADTDVPTAEATDEQEVPAKDTPDDAPKTSSGAADSIPGTSMFDLEARTGDSTTADTSEAPASEDDSTGAMDEGTAHEPEPATTEVEGDDSTEAEPAVRSLRDIKKQYAESKTADDTSGVEPEVETDDEASGAQPGPDEGADDGADDGPVSEPADDEPEAKPAAPGDAHAPKTDVQIDETTSLFDL
jgi:Fe-S oxidoreductase